MATTLEPVAAAVSCGAERSASAAPAGARPALRPRKACLRCSYERNCTDPCETCGEPTRLRRGARDGEHGCRKSRISPAGARELQLQRVRLEDVSPLQGRVCAPHLVWRDEQQGRADPAVERGDALLRRSVRGGSEEGPRRSERGSAKGRRRSSATIRRTATREEE